MIDLDMLIPAEATVGYGALGVRGDLGYEGKRVRVQQRAWEHALSTHPPARLRYALDGNFSEFSARVALNDDVAGQPVRADFVVLADGRAAGVAAGVLAGEPPRTLRASIAGARTLELVARGARFDFCHAVWLEPRLERAPLPATLPDCLHRATLTRPQPSPRARACVATVSSPGFEGLLDDLLRSLRAHGELDGDTLVVVFVQPEDRAGQGVAARYGAQTLVYQPHRTVNPTLKSLLYSVGHCVVAERYLCLDADMVVLGAVGPLFAALDACPEGSILAVREANSGESGAWTLAHALRTVYRGREGDLRRLLARVDGEAGYPLVVNDGLFAAGRTGLMALDGLIRSMEGAPAFTDERGDVWWRNQFVFNLALARMRCGVPLDDRWNVQMDCQEVELGGEGEPRALWQGRPARVLHFNGRGRQKHAAWRAALGRRSPS